MRARAVLRSPARGPALAIVVAIVALAGMLLPGSAGEVTRGAGSVRILSSGLTPSAPTTGGPAAETQAAGSPGELSVLQTDLPGYNGSLPGGFFGTVDDWEVGTSALVPSTGILWLPQLNLYAGNASSPASLAPAVEFNVSRDTFVGIDRAISNASALLYDPANGLLYASQPHNDTVGGYNATTGAPSGPTYKVGGDPVALAYDPPTHFLFVANKATNNVTIINPVAGLVVYSDIPVGTAPVALADDPQDEWLFVANSGGATVSVVNASSPDSAVNPITLSASATGIAYDQSTGTVGITISSTSNMTIVDAKSRATLYGVISVGAGASAIVPSANGSEFVVANATGTDLTRVSASNGSVSATRVTVQPHPTELLLDSEIGEVFSWSNSSRLLQQVNTTTSAVTSTSAPLYSATSGIAFDSIASTLIDGQTDSKLIIGLDPYSSQLDMESIAVTGTQIAIAFDPALNEEFVGLNGSVQAYNSTSGALVASNNTLTGANGPLLYDSASGTLWVGRPSSHDIVGLNASTLLGVATWNSITVNSAATQSIALDPVDSYLFAFDTGTGKINVYNASSHTHVATGLDAGTNVTALGWDPFDGLVYAGGKGTVEAINGSTLAVTGATLALPSDGHATGIAYDPTRGAIFIASAASATGPGVVEEIPATSAPEANLSLTSVRIGDGPTSVAVAPPSSGSLAGLSSILVAENTSGAIAVLGTPPSVDSFTFTPAAIDVGGTTEAVVVPSGGAGGTTVAFLGLPSSCASSDSLALACMANTSGTYSVSASLTDALGETAWADATLQVNGSIELHASYGSLATPETDVGVRFHVHVTSTGGTPPVQYAWSFGDGGTGTGDSPGHTYHTPGSYVVSVTATDAAGGRAVASSVVEILPLPVASIAALPSTSTDVEIPLNLSATVTGGTTPGTGSWEFADGTTATTTNVSHAWAQEGAYNVTYTYTDASGETSTPNTTITVNPLPTASFSATPASSPGAFGSSATYSFTASVTGGTDPIAVTWLFGDGSEANGTSVKHTYGSAGSYDVEASAVDAAGAVYRSTILVQVPASSSTSGPWWGGDFVPALVLGLVVGGTGAAVALFSLDRSRRPPPQGPPSAYVPPDLRTMPRRD